MTAKAGKAGSGTFRKGLQGNAFFLPFLALAAGLALTTCEEAIGHLSISIAVAFSAGALVLAFATVFAALRHAEAIAHHVGEPFGTLVLTVCVTAIEVSVIVAVMLSGKENPTLVRESVFSTVIIVCGGVLGICLTLGGLRHTHQELKRQGTSALLSVVVALSVLTLILPDYTLTSVSGTYSPLQLVFVSLLCLLLYGSFVFAQMTRHRDDFLDDSLTLAQDDHASGVPGLGISMFLLGVSLVSIVMLAEYVATGLEHGLAALRIGQTDAIIGAFIAMLVLMPETLAAIRASMRNELQRSLNIALGSACATIGLTVPIVAAVSMLTGTRLTLGLEPGDTVLLVLVLGISILSFATGRTNVLTGLVHLVVFVAYLMLIAIP
ncbi:MAG: ionic transporter [Rhizobiaceae bacterium]|nr:ionic transporter [Rhizobiaceae bacterium]